MTPQTIVITGASRGIGALCARTLVHQGHHVVATMRDVSGRNRNAAQALLREAEGAPGTLQVRELDVTQPESIRRAIAEIECERPIDVLVNNAGVMPVGVTEAFSIEEMRRCFDVNFYGAVETTQAVLPAMRASGRGLLIHISSAAGRLAIPFFGVYCASKWALEAFSESLHHEVESFGIESILVEPSAHGTDLVNTAPSPNAKERAGSYGALAAGGTRLLGMFQEAFEQADAITDAQNVADAIAGLIAQSGPRPRRTVVGQDMGLAQINKDTAPVQAQLIEHLRPVYGAAS